MKITFQDVGLAELDTCAQAFSRVLQPGDVVVLVGDIGAGKTTFVSALARAYGITDEVTSPTFAIVAEYSSDKARLVHIDTYRLTHVNELFDLGIETLFSDASITLIEWGDRIADVLDQSHFTLSFDDERDDVRTITFEWDDSAFAHRSDHIARELETAGGVL
jgi:tRNA threonylcarbamoyladenosine biosynthesis protein TsaE